MSRKTTKQALKDFTIRAFDDHENARQELIEKLEKNQLTGTFGPGYVEHVQRTESLIKAIDLTPEFVNGDEYENLTLDEIQEWIEDSYRSLSNREKQYLHDGISTRDVYSLSGVSQYRIFLEQFIK
jgi:DNA-binding protein YbaB